MANGPIVSSESELLILVDQDDNTVGFLDKAACHDGKGLLHRAFSVFILNSQGEILLQRRSLGKRLWGGFGLIPVVLIHGKGKAWLMLPNGDA